MKINLNDKCGKKKTITREDGKIINEMIKGAWDNEDKIIIDLDNITIASVSFLDEAFGKLAFEYSKETLLKKLSFENVNEFDRALLNDIFISRFHQKALGENGFSQPKKKKSPKQPSAG
ncbi:MAG: hypothetical protein COS90_05675 [Deltaproteobacteria bacterium CG07_land_8_20_14_0_80_60_11]|nr:MAG: hypothetical protein COS90_05675 [Deltaproteobacteria bacterium CG07_land_8_20_14_0_80_60_11]